MGVKILKHYSCYKSQPSFETCPEFSSQWSSQNYGWDFLNFEFPIFNDFCFWKFKFTIVAYREIKNLNYLENERS